MEINMAQAKTEAALPERIKKQILTAWQEGHGGNAEQAHLLQGDEGLVLLIPKALYQAEIELTHNSEGGSRVFNRYLRSLVDSVSSELLPLVETYTNQNIDEIIPLIDPRAGWIIAFYRFGK
jgi:hypothetical protein